MPSHPAPGKKIAKRKKLAKKSPVAKCGGLHQHLVDLVVQQAKRIKKKKKKKKKKTRELASSCVHNQNTTQTERRCKMSIQLYARIGLRVGVETKAHDMDFFVVAVYMRSHELDLYPWFCSC